MVSLSRNGRHEKRQSQCGCNKTFHLLTLVSFKECFRLFVQDWANIIFGCRYRQEALAGKEQKRDSLPTLVKRGNREIGRIHSSSNPEIRNLTIVRSNLRFLISGFEVQWIRPISRFLPSRFRDGHDLQEMPVRILKVVPNVQPEKYEFVRPSCSIPFGKPAKFHPVYRTHRFYGYHGYSCWHGRHTFLTS